MTYEKEKKREKKKRKKNIKPLHFPKHTKKDTGIKIEDSTKYISESLRWIWLELAV